MKNTSRLAVLLLPFLFSAKGFAAEQKRPVSSKRKLAQVNGPQGAVGVVDVFLYRNKNIAQRCTATHVGNGLVVTSGHCFLGAYDCNEAKVTWNNEEFTSRCQYVLYSNASESYSNGTEISNDLTVFKVDRYPRAQAFVPAQARLTETNLAKDAVLISMQRTGENTTPVTSSNCQIILGPVVNIFSQPKPLDTARHNCDLSDISSGSPVLSSSSNQLLAIHQGTSLLPNPDGSTNFSGIEKVHYAKVISESDIQRIINLPTALPENIRIGGFAGEVFNTGIKEPLSFTVANLQARVGTSTVSFGIHNGLDSIIEATDGDGKTMIFGGPRRAGYDQRFRMKAPVKITLSSTKNGIAPLAWLENIQSP